jgi:hypothetical protein
MGRSDSGEFRVITPVEPSRSGPPLELGDDLDSMVGEEFESVEGTFARNSEPRALSLDLSSEGVPSSSFSASEE